jgi:hypothetical protein
MVGMTVVTLLKYGRGGLDYLREASSWLSVDSIVEPIGLAGVFQFGAELAWPWIPVVGTLATFTIGLAASIVWPAGGRSERESA